MNDWAWSFKRPGAEELFFTRTAHGFLVESSKEVVALLPHDAAWALAAWLDEERAYMNGGAEWTEPTSG